jgi:hypothetical protein
MLSAEIVIQVPSLLFLHSLRALAGLFLLRVLQYLCAFPLVIISSALVVINSLVITSIESDGKLTVGPKLSQASNYQLDSLPHHLGGQLVGNKTSCLGSLNIFIYTETIMPHSHSFQLPDLLSIVGSLELRTNPHCRFVTDGYENWISGEPDILTANELTYLRSTKLGLLAALCFPTCDVPQLRILTDFIATIFYSGMRECAPGYSSNLLKREEQFYTMDVSESEERQSAIDILKAHELFKQLRAFPFFICLNC